MLKQLLAVVIVSAACAMSAFAKSPAPATTPATTYDKSADQRAVIKAAEHKAASSHKKVLLVFGGDWCVDCRVLQIFLDKHPGVEAELERSFAIAHVYIAPDNFHPDFLAEYPAFHWVPELFVLDSKGKFLEAQDSRVFETSHFFIDGALDEKKLTAFAQAWRSK